MSQQVAPLTSEFQVEVNPKLSEKKRKRSVPRRQATVYVAKEMPDDQVWTNIVASFVSNRQKVMKLAFKGSTAQTAQLITNSFLMGCCTLLGDFIMTIALSAVGVAFAYLYSAAPLVINDAFNQLLLLLIVIAPIFTVWNIAQYASFAIQTTGHIWPRNHWWAVKDIGPALLATNTIAWCMIILSYNTWDLSVVPPVIIHVPILAFAILTGIWLKTNKKVSYVVNKFNIRSLAERRDAFLSKTYAMVANIDEAGGLTCPFQSKNKKTVAHHAMGPILCFLWTAVYTIGLGLLYHVSEDIYFKWFLFVLALGIHLIGQRWLGQLIKNQVGMLMYSKKMIVMFFYIYGMVSCSQIRLVITKFEGTSRLVAGILFALFSFFLRLKTVHKLKNKYAQVRNLSEKIQREIQYDETELVVIETDAVQSNRSNSGLKSSTESASDSKPKVNNLTRQPTGTQADRKQLSRQMRSSKETIAPFVDASRWADQFVIGLVTSIITQNTCTIITAGLSCAFIGNQFLSVGDCPNGFFNQAIYDLAPLIAFDFMEIFMYSAALKIPTFHVFRQFDWFMVVAAILVSYLNVIVIIWALSPMFSVTPTLLMGV